MSEPKKRWRYGFKRWLIIGLTILGAYAAFFGPSILKPISPVVVIPGEPTGLSIGGFEITNTMLATLLADVILILIALGAWRFHKKGNLVDSRSRNSEHPASRANWKTHFPATSETASRTSEESRFTKAACCSTSFGLAFSPDELSLDD